MNCRAHIAVPEPFLDLLERYAVGEQERCAGVAQVVKRICLNGVLLRLRAIKINILL